MLKTLIFFIIPILVLLMLYFGFSYLKIALFMMGFMLVYIALELLLSKIGVHKK